MDNFKKVLLIAVIFFLPFIASAADLSFSPASGSYPAGQVFPVAVYVSSPGQAANAFSGTIHFPADKLNVSSISSSNSIVSIWVQAPSFSNATGTVTFEGIAVNPGYAGASGNLITVNFRAVSAGQADIKFSTGSVLANDGEGTNILQNFGSASYSITAAVQQPAKTKTEQVVQQVAQNVAKKVENAANEPNALNIGELVATLFLLILCLLGIIFLLGSLFIFIWRRFSRMVLSLRKELGKLKYENNLEERELALLREKIKNTNLSIRAEDQDFHKMKSEMAVLNQKVSALASEVEKLKASSQKPEQPLPPLF